MKGPLYRAPAAQPAPATTITNEEKVPTEQENAISATKENPDSCLENTAAADEQQVLTEQDKSENNSESTVKEDLDNSSENTTENN